MTIDDKVRDEKLQYDINRETAEISALSSGKIGKYEYLASEEILLSNQRQIKEQVKFPYSRLGKAFEKRAEKQVGALTSLDHFNNKDELKRIEGMSSENLMSNLIRLNLEKVLKNQRNQNVAKLIRDIHEGHLSLKAKEFCYCVKIF